MSYSKSHFIPSQSASVQIMARRVTVVASKQTRSGVTALNPAAFGGIDAPTSPSRRPRSMVLTLISAVATVWSLLTLFGHY
jgi:hypothetical protein